MTLRAAAAVLLLALLAPTPARAVSDAEVNAAVDRGMAWLRTQQQQDGAFRGHWNDRDYKTGETALALLALLKAGAAPDDPAIERGFAWLCEQPLQRTYEVSVAVLAIEARYTPETQASIESDQPLATQIRRRFQRVAPPRDRDFLARCVQFLLANQHASGLWAYPFFGEPDVSNAQFALLALKAAVRMGARVPVDVYVKAVTYLLENQEAAGTDVPSFPVPAADQTIAGLHDRRDREREREREQGGGGTRTRPPGSEDSTRQRMQARGWGYRPGQGTRGSMTAAALAMLVIAKSELEDMPRYGERLGPQVDRALRDGAAWIASRFRADRNPGAEPDWLLYYLYTLERAGTLLALDRFGARDWYQEGASVILGLQQDDGRIVASTGGELDGELAGTCLGLLFLKRSTVPVVRRVRTGGDAYGAGASGGPTVVAADGGQFRVTFRFALGAGHRVTVAGSFNGWSRDATPLADPDGDGTYEGQVTLGPGRHTYKFVVDGQAWHQDPTNPQQEPDGHGGQNSVVVTGS